MRKLVVGLGNPGSKYEGTRHNIGFEVVDRLAEGGSGASFSRKFDGLVAETEIDFRRVLLLKPETFMNLSGRCVREVTDFYQLELADLLVVCDDINLPLGKLRVRAKGTHGGHNGLRDIQAHLGTTEYARLRVGVDAPRDDAVDHVLGRFSAAERRVIDDTVVLACQAVLVWAGQGVEACMNQYNGPKDSN
jgi:PTH1 family peptidyl-tRNA hydrolase